MKSSFLFLVILSFIVGMTTAVAQDAAPKTDFDKFYDRLKVSYFGAYQGSCLSDWGTGACDEMGVADKTYPHNIFNQVSFSYNFGARFNLVINPRWTLNTGDTSAVSKGSNGILVLEDPLVGFAGAWYKSEDGKFVAWSRIGARLPVSHSSRNNDITIQPEAFNIFSYDYNETWSYGLYSQFRFWVYEQNYTDQRYRVFLAPYVQYKIDDKTKLQVFYENYTEKRGTPSTVGSHSYENFNTYWSNAMVALSVDLTPKFNLFPYLGYHLNSSEPIQEYPADPLWVGAWISYQIK